MKKIEFDKKLKQIEGERKEKIRKLKSQYANENNTCHIGDIIENNYGIKIIIESIGYRNIYFTDYTECYYEGPKLKKNGARYKSGEFDKIYQSNIKNNTDKEN